MATPKSSSTRSAAARNAKGAAKDITKDAKQKASATADEAKKKAAQTAKKAKQSAKNVAGTAKSEAQDLAAQAKDTAADKARTAKKTVADVASDAAPVLDAAADQLRDDGHDAFARYAEQAADGVGQFTSAIRDKSVGELLDEAERFARREPGLFVGGAFLLGVLGARFLKAGGSDASSSRETSSADGSRRLPQRASLRGEVSGPSGALPGAARPSTTTQTA